jgi:hypothetical protein
MMRFMCTLGLVCLQLAAAESVPNWWRDHALAHWNPQGTTPVALEEAVARLQRSNPDLKNIRLRYAGEIERDSVAQHYLHWLALNASAQTDPKDLLPRSEAVRRALKTYGGDELWVVGPRGIVRIISYPTWEAHVSPPNLTAMQWENLLSSLRRGAYNRPDSAQLAAEAQAPDSSFRIEFTHKVLLGMGTGVSALFGRQDRAGVDRDLLSNYGVDSASVWNWLEPQGPALYLSLGQEHARMLGYGLEGGWESYKTRMDLETQAKVQSWTWSHRWFGAYLRGSYPWFKWRAEWLAYGQFGVSYHFFGDQLQAKGVLLGGEQRFEIPMLNGSSLAFGGRYSPLALPWWAQIELRLHHMSRPAEENFQGPTQTKIAGASSRAQILGVVGWSW